MTTPVLQTRALAKRFGRTWGLRECTVSIPTGKVCALVGPNGAGKSTLLRVAAGLWRPTSGEICVLGETPGASSLRARVGYLDQERPLYRGFRVDEMLRFCDGTNPGWDMASAHAHLDQLGISPRARVDALSGGQRAQVALTMCLAKRPELLILHEPAAALDPDAREDILRRVMRDVAEHATNVMLSTHALGDVASICDYLVIMSHSSVVLADDLEFILESHRFLSSHSLEASPPEGAVVIDSHVGGREVTHLVRLALPLVDESWRVGVPTLDEIIMAYLRRGADPSAPRGRS